MTDPRLEAGHGPVVVEPVDKRRSPRYPFSTGGEAFDIQPNVRITGRLSDISRHGSYVDTISPFAVDAAIGLTVTKQGCTFKTKVVYSLNGMGIGMMFTTTEPDQVRVLQAWLNELSGGYTWNRIRLQPTRPLLIRSCGILCAN
jgi:hypothetical protein